MSDWLIATPAWGERCVDLFVNVALPAIKIASDQVGGRFRFIVHTDEPVRIEHALSSYEHDMRPVPSASGPHQSAGLANREALAEAQDGECVAFINADMVPSREVFAAAERRFFEGRRLIMMGASRTLGGQPPIGAASADLLRWTMQHRHPAIEECFWGHGRAKKPWAIYFVRGDDIVLHGFHLHPFALKKDRVLAFEGITIDSDLADRFRPNEIHLVTEPDEAAFAEISPPGRVFPLLDEPMDVKSVCRWARSGTTPLHRWLFDQPITITGTGTDVGDGKVCSKILAKLEQRFLLRGSIG